MLETRETGARAGRSDLGGQEMEPPLEMWCGNGYGRADGCGQAEAAQPARVPDHTRFCARVSCGNPPSSTAAIVAQGDLKCQERRRARPSWSRPLTESWRGGRRGDPPTCSCLSLSCGAAFDPAAEQSQAWTLTFPLTVRLAVVFSSCFPWGPEAFFTCSAIAPPATVPFRLIGGASPSSCRRICRATSRSTSTCPGPCPEAGAAIANEVAERRPPRAALGALCPCFIGVLSFGGVISEGYPKNSIGDSGLALCCPRTREMSQGQSLGTSLLQRPVLT